MYRHTRLERNCRNGELLLLWNPAAGVSLGDLRGARWMVDLTVDREVEPIPSTRTATLEDFLNVRGPLNPRPGTHQELFGRDVSLSLNIPSLFVLADTITGRELTGSRSREQTDPSKAQAPLPSVKPCRRAGASSYGSSGLVLLFVGFYYIV